MQTPSMQYFDILKAGSGRYGTTTYVVHHAFFASPSAKPLPVPALKSQLCVIKRITGKDDGLDAKAEIEHEVCVLRAVAAIKGDIPSSSSIVLLLT